MFKIVYLLMVITLLAVVSACTETKKPADGGANQPHDGGDSD